MTVKNFQKKIWDYYRKYGRHDLPWRPSSLKLRRDKIILDPYKILVSEMMLQQTQAARVVPKYKAFLKKFPTIEKLTKANTRDVLKEWSGLGYNRRALYLKRAAETIVRDYKGIFPKEVSLLEKLPGIGPYTARAIATFAWNQPQIFIETNIRAVFIHEFSSKKGMVSQVPIHDKDLLELIKKTLPEKSISLRPSSDETMRQWYWALMDYGAMLKATVPNPSRKSAHHTRQSKFEGSDRQIRGAIVRLLVSNKKVTERMAIRLLSQYSKNRVLKAWRALKQEGF